MVTLIPFLILSLFATSPNQKKFKTTTTSNSNKNHNHKTNEFHFLHHHHHLLLLLLPKIIIRREKTITRMEKGLDVIGIVEMVTK